jgi:hypothetical protein
MARIPEAEVERLKAEVPLLELVASYGVQLRAKGKGNWVGLCPLHPDRTPSLVVSPQKGLWNCLGACSLGGTCIDWVMAAERIGFREALERLLRRYPSAAAAPAAARPKRGAGRTALAAPAELPAELPAAPAPAEPSGGEAQPAELLPAGLSDRELMRAVLDYYHQRLLSGPNAALAYLQSRGLADRESIEHFGLGYCDGSIQRLLPTRASKDGAALREALRRLGLVSSERGTERYLNCVVVPVFGPDGELVELYGRRALKRSSSGTALHLYLPAEARGPSRGVWNRECLQSSEEVLLCEALLDALTAWRHGFRNVLSAYGVNGLTQEHLEALCSSRARRVLLLYDRDEAGEKAAARDGKRLMARGLEAYRVLLPHGMDLNEYAQKVSPPHKALELLIRKAEWMGKGKKAPRRPEPAASAAAAGSEPAAPGPAAPELDAGAAAPLAESAPEPGAAAPLAEAASATEPARPRAAEPVLARARERSSSLAAPLAARATKEENVHGGCEDPPGLAGEGASLSSAAKKENIHDNAGLHGAPAAALASDPSGREERERTPAPKTKTSPEAGVEPPAEAAVLAAAGADVTAGAASSLDAVAAGPLELAAPRAAAPELPAPPTGSLVPPAPELGVSVHAAEPGKPFELEVGSRLYRVSGLEKNLAYGTLKVCLRVRFGQEVHTDTLELASARARAQFVKEAAATLALQDEVLRRDLGKLYLVLEGMRDRQIAEAQAPKKPAEAEMSAERRAAALELLRDGRLMERIVEDLERCGLVGEATNKLVCYLVALSRKLPKALAAMILSASAAGKSALMNAVVDFVPPEDVVKHSAMTGQALYYMEPGALRHKLLCIAEQDGAHSASYSLKLLISEGEVSIASVGKDGESGRLGTQLRRVEGPAAVLTSSTAYESDEELVNRCLVTTVNESREQTRAIHRRQRAARSLAGLAERQRQGALERLHQDAQRLLRPLAVVNPYAEHLTFLDEQMRTRRDHGKYLGLIDCIALLHQYQRSLRVLHEGGERVEYIEVEPSDIAIAGVLMSEVLGRSLDELPPHTRTFVELLAGHVRQECERHGLEQSELRFWQKDVRAWTGWSPVQVKKQLAKLVELEYVLAHRGRRGQSVVYELLYRGEGQDGRPFLMGLLDVSRLPEAEAAKAVERKWLWITRGWDPQNRQWDPSGTLQGPVKDPSGPAGKTAPEASSDRPRQASGGPGGEKRSTGVLESVLGARNGTALPAAGGAASGAAAGARP